MTPERTSDMDDSIRRGLADAAAGRVSDLGSFAQYAEDERPYRQSPPYPFPGWSGDSEAPEGYAWEWQEADEKWRLGGDGKRCRYTVGPAHATCKRPAVVTLDRSWSSKRPNRWGYCEQHLFSRHIHDDAIWEGVLRRAANDGSHAHG